MIISHGKFPVRADRLEQAKEIMTQMAEETMKEAGCLTYDFYESLTDPSTILLFQEWSSIEAIQDHFATEHMSEFLRVLPEILEGEVIAHRYAVQTTAEPDQEFNQDFLSEEIEEESVTLH